MKRKAHKQTSRGNAYPYDRSNTGEELDGQKSESQGSDESSEQEGQGLGSIVQMAKKLTKNMDGETMAKYAAVGLLAFVALRKSGFIGGLLVSVAAGVVTKYMMEQKASKDEHEEYEQEEGGEEQQGQEDLHIEQA